MTPLILYNHPVSSYAQKVRIALREKSLPFTTPNFPAPGSDDAVVFSAANPRLEVPTLIDGAVQLFDSSIILEYLEDRYPEPALLPPPRTHAAERAKARLIEEICDTAYEAINWGSGEVVWMGRADHSPELRAKLLGEAERQTRVLQAWLEEKLGGHEYFGGEFGFGWADVCAAPFVNRSDYFEWGPAEGSKLRAWLKRVKERESVKATLAEFHEAVGNMSKLAPVFMSGERKREYRDHRLEWMVKSGGIEVVTQGLEKNNIRFVWPDAQS